MLQFNSTEELKAHFGIQADVTIGEASYVKTIKHSIVASEEGCGTYVEVGTLIGNSIIANEDIAVKADGILGQLNKYLESGDHDGVISIEMLKLDSNYRLHQTYDDERAYEQLDKPTVQELLDFIH